MDGKLVEEANLPLSGTRPFVVSLDTYSRIHELVLHSSVHWPRMILDVVLKWGLYDKDERHGDSRVIHLDKHAARVTIALLMRDLVSTWSKRELSNKHDRTRQAVDEMMQRYVDAYGCTFK